MCVLYQHRSSRFQYFFSPSPLQLCWMKSKKVKLSAEWDLAKVLEGNGRVSCDEPRWVIYDLVELLELARDQQPWTCPLQHRHIKSSIDASKEIAFCLFFPPIEAHHVRTHKAALVVVLFAECPTSVNKKFAHNEPERFLWMKLP